jgi:starch-binding outer membrane protein, SusD/RagB family
MFNNNNTELTDALVQGNLSAFEGGQEKISWKKYTSLYKNNATFYTGPMNMRIIRYAEVLLNLAEVENELGNSSTAIGYLNEIRNRPSVSLPNYPIAGKYPVNSKDEVFKAIVHEKRVELAGEQHRNREILRWRRQGKLATEPIPYFQANKFERLPIPQVEFATNASLTPGDQNPGY